MKKEWKDVKLIDLVDKIFSGGTPNTQKAEYWNGNIYWLSSGEIKNGFIRNTERKITNLGVKNSSTKLAKKRDVLVASAGQGLTRGQTSFSMIDTYINQSIIAIRTKNDILNPLFLFYNLLSRYKELRSISDSSSSRGSITCRILENLNIRLPPIKQQKTIAAILSAYDDLIENNTRRIQILEEMALALYHEWFVNFRFPGHEEVKMVESELGAIPEGWEVKKLSELVETQYGYTETASEDEVGPKFVRGTDINKTPYIQWDTVPYCPISSEEYSKYKLNVGDIVVIRMADPGKVGVVEKEIDAVFASYLIRFNIISSKLSPYYLFYFLLSDRYQNYATGASTGTTRKSASAGVLADINIVIPQAHIRESFEGRVTAIRRMLNNLLDKNVNLRQTRDLLLPRLISGDLDLLELDIATEELKP